LILLRHGEVPSHRGDVPLTRTGRQQAQVTRIAFYADFLASADRIGTWLHHADPPGEAVATVASRIWQLAASLDHVDRADLVVGVTQSPVIRSLARHYAGTDPGEPGYLHGYHLRTHRAGRVEPSPVDWQREPE